MGERIKNCREAIRKISKSEKISIEKVSPLYETEPIDYVDQERFINCVIEVTTSLSPREVLKEMLQIEEELGRKRGMKWGPRIIDLDLLLYDSLVLKEDDLVIPHPRMHERRFVLQPLYDIFPDFIHPELKKSINKLLELLGEEQNVKEIKKSKGKS